MTRWQPITLDRGTAHIQLTELRQYLNASPTLAEGALRDFIRSREQIVASLGLLNAAVDKVDRWAPELDLMGKHSCDFVVGDGRRCAYTLVELEDGSPESVYETAPATPYFTRRFNHGYSQIVDWLCLLDGTQNTLEFCDYFGQAAPPQFVGLLVIGRREALVDPEAYRRLEWRSGKVRVNSHPVLCSTYEDLIVRLIDKLEVHLDRKGAAG